jgi:hypothetical protein
MIIKYKCNRCKKVTDVRLGGHRFNYKANNQEKYDLPDIHYRMDCLFCNRLIKFIGVAELSGLEIDLDKIPITHKGKRKKVRPGEKAVRHQKRKKHQVTLDELNFKLDLIIAALGI